jgi:protein-L-isoaspartate(D-aspartate) O-methyltransferase
MYLCQNPVEKSLDLTSKRKYIKVVFQKHDARLSMPSCKKCGIDIPRPGLCAECRSELAKAGKKGGASFTVTSSARFLIVITALTALLIAGIVIVIVFTSPPPPLANGQSAAPGPDTERDSGDSHGTASADTDTGSDSTTGGQENTTAADTADYDEAAVQDITENLTSPPIDNKDDYIAWMLKHTNENEASLSLRWERAQLIIKAGHGEFADKNALRAYLLTPRERFTRGQDLFLTYGDRPLQIGYGQTITAPNVMAMMTTSLKVEPQHKVLEIGMGSGYQAAVLARLTGHVYTIEIIEGLYRETDQLFTSLAKEYPVYKNIMRKLDDGYYGWEEYAPFDRIIVTCSIDHLPLPLIKQLKVGGIIVVPLGPPYRQFLMQIEKIQTEDSEIKLVPNDVYDGLGVIFVPFTNKEGESYSGE